jgi:hypothetical protein
MIRPGPGPLLAIVLALTVVALAGCGRLTRVATINQVTKTPGAQAEATLEQQLAKLGVSNPQVTCARNLIVNVGTTTTCKLTGAEGKRLVAFRFADKHGAVKLTSVRAY